jgi:hypothetical protein
MCGRRREHNYILQQLVQIVGKSVGLYNKVKQQHRGGEHCRWALGIVTNPP